MASTILSIRRETISRSRTCLILAWVALTDAPIPWINSSTAVLFVPKDSLMSPICFWLTVARSCATSRPRSIWLIAAEDSSVAAAAVCEPRRICSIAVIICVEARLISCTAEDNSSALEATSSALFATSVEFRRSSARSNRL